MAQTLVELTDAQMTALEMLAKKQNTTLPQLIQDSIKNLIGESTPQYTSDQKKRALSIIGKFESDHTDLSINHDDHFIDAIQS